MAAWCAVSHVAEELDVGTLFTSEIIISFWTQNINSEKGTEQFLTRYLLAAVLRGRNDVEMGPANSLHASA